MHDSRFVPILSAELFEKTLFFGQKAAILFKSSEKLNFLTTADGYYIMIYCITVYFYFVFSGIITREAVERKRNG